MAPSPTELRHRYGEEFSEFQDITFKNDLPKDCKLVGVDGNWYDVTDFFSKHPGGPIIEQFIGKDASAAFKTVWHHEGVLNHRKPVGTYKVAKRHPAHEDFEDLVKKFEEWGWYETDWFWYGRKTLVALALFVTALYLVIGCEQWYLHYAGAVILTLSWQQCGFIMHDSMHKQLFRNSRTLDCLIGLIYGSFMIGFSAHWWHDEHIIHHVACNTVDIEQHFADPQMWELSWAQNEKLYPFFSGYAQYFLIKIQHITFIPLVVLWGRFEIVIDSHLKERRWYEFLALGGHWVYMSYLLSWLPTWHEVFIFYMFIVMTEGFFHFQLILSHYCKAFFTITEYHKTSWYVVQVLSNMNIDVPWWQDWVYGGLNFHIEHHLFPRLGRRHLREAGAYVEQICKKHDIDYDMCPFSTALWKTLVHLKKAGSHYKLEFR